MNQLDVFRTRGEAARLAPFLVLLQHDLLAGIASVVVAPLRPEPKDLPPLKGLHATVDFQGERHLLAPEQMVSLPRSALGPRAGSLADQRQSVMAAVDFLFQGF